MKNIKLTVLFMAIFILGIFASGCSNTVSADDKMMDAKPAMQDGDAAKSSDAMMDESINNENSMMDNSTQDDGSMYNEDGSIENNTMDK